MSIVDLLVGLRAETIEQVMRSATDEVAVLTFLDVAPASAAACAALGQLLGEARVHLSLGCPLAAFCSPEEYPFDPSWRDTTITTPGSLWGELEMLRMLYGTPEEPLDAYSEFVALRAIADADLAS